MSLAFAPAQPSTSTPDQLPALDAGSIDALLQQLLHGPTVVGGDDRPWSAPAAPCIVLDGDDDEDEDEDDDDFFEDDDDEEWEDDYEDDLDDDDDEEFEDDFEDDDEEL